MSRTAEQYQRQLNVCRDIFLKKMSDYGTAWRILRSSSLTDQIFIKANRIRTLQETKNSRVGEGIEGEFVGIVNYCIMALIQLGFEDKTNLNLSKETATTLYDRYAREAFELMERKNHDYGEAWRDMRISSLTDLILMKVLRVKQIEDQDGKTLISEGVEAGYFDMLNYAIFALILMESPAQLKNQNSTLS